MSATMYEMFSRLNDHGIYLWSRVTCDTYAFPQETQKSGENITEF